MKAIIYLVLSGVISFGILFMGRTVSMSISGEDNEKSPFHSVMPDGGEFFTTDVEGLPDTVTEAYRSETGGYVFRLDAMGYYPHMMILCGVGADGKITGAVCTESSESLGREMSYGEEFVGLDANGAVDVPLITGATKTTKGYRKAILAALEAFDILKGR